jgi:hypothetical protein
MGILITSDDFTGLYRVSENYNTEEDFEIVIDTFEKEYLQDLLGCELYDLFVADVDPITKQPVTQIYIDIYNAFCKEDSLCVQNRSFGMVDMLCAFIYWEWLRQNQLRKTSIGTVVADAENASHARPTSTMIYVRYNRGIRSFKAIQRFICDNSSDYPTFEGIQKQFISTI